MANLIDVYIARQPIYDRSLHPVAYELLFRAENASEAGVIGPAESARALITSLVDIGLSRLVGNLKAFVNVDETTLLSEALVLLPRDRTVFEILETVEGNPENLKAVAKLRTAGYTIALDDFSSTGPGREFLPYATVVKLDVLALGAAFTEHARRLSSSRVALLAEKIETRAQFEMCKQLGCKYFQGFYFSRPEIVHGRSLPPHKAECLELARKLQNPDIELDELEALVCTNVALSHRLLQMVHCAQLGISGNVNSVRQAIMFLGLQRVASLATLLAISGVTTKPSELIVTSLVRAKMCETLAQRLGFSHKDRFFTAGMLSALDALLDLPMSAILEELPLEAEISEALLGRSTGPVADTLCTAVSWETGRWEGSKLDAPKSAIQSAYLEALHWVGAINVVGEVRRAA